MSSPTSKTTHTLSSAVQRESEYRLRSTPVTDSVPQSILLVEPYGSGSHLAWAEGFERSSSHDVQLLTLPGRFWKWRMFGGTLTLAQQAVELASKVGPPDLVLASDMLDLPSFLGHAGNALGSPKTVLYMHENQLTYPLSPTARDDLAYAYMNWSSMVRADEVWFNSQFHLESVFEALPKFLKHFPDHRHVRLLDAVAAKSKVVPVGVDLEWIEGTEKSEPPLIIWNQRWEYDKDPVRLFQALHRLAEGDIDFRLAICGENFRNVPIEFEESRNRLEPQIIQYGYAERAEYEHLLLDASVVVSTAKHEFFGIGAVEAMAAGAVPVFPNDLSYPALIPTEIHNLTLYDSDEELDRLLSAALIDRTRNDEIRSYVEPAMQRFSWEVMTPVYDAKLRQT